MKKILGLMAVAAMASATLAQVIDKNYDGGTVGSLWNDHAANPMLDRKACQEGDLITIVISETSSATYSANTTTTKTDSNNVGLNLFNNIVSRLIRPWTSSDSSSNAGTGTTGQSNKLTAKMTATVKKVMANGTLVIEGTRSVLVNREVQTYKISGLVRKDDVKSDNTVLSENIADADIRLEGKGAIYDRQRRGLLTRVLDWLF